ncbi:MAG: Ada metal-binding domain-containing protein [Pseudomonadota bacterium]
MLDFEECNKARLRRDPDYDGRFFIGVKTTKIYCRPVCKVKQPKTENVVFFPSAAAAEIDGFRPCLRCRPETAPFCPAWKGTKTTVERALSMIDSGALDTGTVRNLAARLGVGERHLSRLFNQHIGASPLQVAKTRRTHIAKRLLGETDLSIKEVAHEAGFPSERRMHAAFAALYKRPPSIFRKHRGRQPR